MILAIWLVIAALGALEWLRRGFAVVRISGTSMLPSYKPGDVLLIRRRIRGRIRVGDVVVLREPMLRRDDQGRLQIMDVRIRRRRWVVKRVAALAGDPIELSGRPERMVRSGSVVVLGDNPDQSIDSRQFGPIGISQVIGVVIQRMHDGTEGISG